MADEEEKPEKPRFRLKAPPEGEPAKVPIGVPLPAPPVPITPQKSGLRQRLGSAAGSTGRYIAGSVGKGVVLGAAKTAELGKKGLQAAVKGEERLSRSGRAGGTKVRQGVFGPKGTLPGGAAAKGGLTFLSRIPGAFNPAPGERVINPPRRQVTSRGPDYYASPFDADEVSPFAIPGTADFLEDFDPLTGRIEPINPPIFEGGVYVQGKSPRGYNMEWEDEEFDWNPYQL